MIIKAIYLRLNYTVLPTMRILREKGFDILASRLGRSLQNVLGQHVRPFVLAHQSPGNYSIVWDGRDDAGSELSSGVYWYRLKTEEEAMHNHRAGRTLLVK